MKKKRIVITGIGVVAPNGIGKEEFWSNCAEDVTGIKDITLFDASPYRCRWAGEVGNFQPEEYLGQKGLRNLDRTTLLSLVAAKLAIDDAKLEITDQKRHEVGVVLGSTLGSVHSISEFDKEGLREGPRYVNPAKFPNTVINSPASQVAIRFGLRALNATIGTGFTASLDAVAYAIDALQFGRARQLLVGGVEELCVQLFLGFYKMGFLAVSKNGNPPEYAPLRTDCGAILGEGAGLFMLETMDSAKERGAVLYAEIIGYGSRFSPKSVNRYDSSGTCARAAVRAALDDAGLLATDIDHLSVSANGVKTGDAVELMVLRDIFGERIDSAALRTPKALLGESFSAAGAMQIADGLGVLGQATASQYPGHQRSAVTNHHFDTLLINSTGPSGTSTVLIMRRVAG